MKRKVCILSFSNIAWDARVLREIEAASKNYDVDVIGYGNWDAGKNRFFPVPKHARRTASSVFSKYVRIPFGHINPDFWEQHYWQLAGYQPALQILLKEKYDLIHANDWNSLPVAGQAAKQVGSRVLFDAHEYTPAQAINRPFARFFTLPPKIYLLRTYQSCIGRAITVSNGLKELYQENFGMYSEVIMNAPFYVRNEFRPADRHHIRLVYHGGALRVRYLEDFIYLVGHLEPRYKMNFMLMDSQSGYLESLKFLAKRVAPERIAFHDPVSPHTISRALTQFDVGIPFIRAGILNHYHALPNKFFDYIMAGLAVVLPPLPSMQKIVEENQAGAIAPDQSIEAMASTLNSLSSDDINGFKQNSLGAAQKLNAEAEMEKLMEIYRELLGG